MERFRRLGRLSSLPITFCLAVLGGCGSGSQDSASTLVQALELSGTPPTAIVAGQAYAFAPAVVTTVSAQLTYNIRNKPDWATLNLTSGQLSGIPTSNNVGVYAGIVISASDGTTTAALPAFSIEVRPGTASPGRSGPAITGTPPTVAAAGSNYNFQPKAVDASGVSLGFSIQNKPAWASFNPASGQLFGTPTASQTGNYANIVISVTDGVSSAALPAFSIAVSATNSSDVVLTWVQPTSNADGSALTNLAGYVIYYGTSAAALDQTINVISASTTSYAFTGLPSGTWYFAIKSVDATAVESALTPTVNTTI